MSFTKVEAKFYESRYTRPYRAIAWGQEGQLQCLPRRARTNWSRLDLRQITNQLENSTSLRKTRTRLRTMLKGGLEMGAFGTIFATFLGSLYMLA